MTIRVITDYCTYYSVLRTVDAIQNGDMKNPYENNIEDIELDLDKFKETVQKYSYIYYKEVDDDIIHMALPEIDMKRFYFLFGYGMAYYMQNEFDLFADYKTEPYIPNLLKKLSDYEENNPEKIAEMLSKEE